METFAKINWQLELNNGYWWLLYFSVGKCSHYTNCDLWTSHMLEVGGCGCGQDHGTDHHHHHHHHPPTPADSLPCLLTLRHVSSVLALFWFIVLWSLSGGNIFDQILRQSLWYFNIGKGVHLSLCKLNNKYKAFNDLKIFQLKKQVTLWHVFVTIKLVGFDEIQQQKISPRQHLPSHISGRDREWLLTWPS